MGKVREEEFIPFNIGPIDKVPKSKQGFNDKKVEDWNWLDFWNYFESKHKEVLGKEHWYNFQQRNAKKGIIEQSYGYWGKDVFKAMIDWLYENYRQYPQWNDIHIGLVCGAHGWAKLIGQQAKKQIELDNHWKGE